MSSKPNTPRDLYVRCDWDSKLDTNTWAVMERQWSWFEDEEEYKEYRVPQWIAQFSTEREADRYISKEYINLLVPMRLNWWDFKRQKESFCNACEALSTSALTTTGEDEDLADLLGILDEISDKLCDEMENR